MAAGDRSQAEARAEAAQAAAAVAAKLAERQRHADQREIVAARELRGGAIVYLSPKTRSLSQS